MTLGTLKTLRTLRTLIHVLMVQWTTIQKVAGKKSANDATLQTIELEERHSQ